MAETTTKRHPIRGAIWGLILGLGVVVYLTLVFPVIALESVSQVATQGIIVIIVVMVLSVLWGMYGPAKAPKGSAPMSAEPPPAEAMPAETTTDEAPEGTTSEV
jgi:Na+/proline symporter